MTTLARTAPRADVRTQLVWLGIGMLFIYVVFATFFPLGPNTLPGRPAFDVESLMRGREWFAPFYVIGVIALYVLFWRVLRIIHTFAHDDPDAADSLRGPVLAAGIVFGVVLFWLYPITALDVFLYVVRTRLWVLYGGSPMLALPEDYPADAWVAFAGEFKNQVSPYGPLWELLARIPVQLGLREMVPGVIGMKVIVLIGYIACATLIGWRARPTQTSQQRGVSPLLALAFFAWNPLIQMQGFGNGHNDMLLLAFLVWGLVLWQRGNWWGAALALTLATMVKATGLLMLPLFGVALLQREPTWRGRILKGLGAVGIAIAAILILYALTGPLPDVFLGAREAVLNRRGFAPTSVFRVLVREFLPRVWSEPLGRNGARDLFILYYAFLMLRVWQGRYSLIAAGFLAYFSQLFLGATFRIWYPMWLIPFAALHLTSRTFWHTFLFGLTAELSIVSYFVLWRWILRDRDWSWTGLDPRDYYWTIMTVFTVTWAFGIPLLVPIWMKARDRARFVRELWL